MKKKNPIDVSLNERIELVKNLIKTTKNEMTKKQCEELLEHYYYIY
jgi:hypothetical protein